MRKPYLFEDYYNIDQHPSSGSDFSIPLGVTDEMGLEEYRISGENRGLILVSGRCGSGKSNYLHTILNSTLLKYSSKDVNIWLYEYKAFEYRAFLNTSIPHITGKWIGHEDHSNEAFIDALEAEIETRKRVFIANDCTNYDHYLRNTGDSHLPRLLVIIEEFDILVHELFEADYSYRYRLDNILQMAHAFGITLVFSVQDVYHCRYITANILSKHIAMRQSDDSIKEQFNTQDAIELSHSLVIGEAIIDIPTIHKIDLLYIKPDIERLVIAKYS